MTDQDMDLRPDIDHILEHIRSLLPDPQLPLPELIAASRRALDSYGDASVRAPYPDVTTIPVMSGKIAGQWLQPNETLGPERIVWFHGGGLIGGSMTSHNAMASELARLTGRPVFLADYRLAPEHKMPAAHDDCLAALRWAQNTASDGSTATAPVWLVGDSIGAGLAVWVSSQAAISKITPPAALVLFSATLNLTPDDRPALSTDPLISAPTLGGISLYAGEVPLTDPRLSTINLPDGAFANFPPTLLQVSSGEYLHPDSLMFARRLALLGQRVHLSVWPGLPHVWHAFLTSLPEARQALREAADFLVRR